MRYKIVFLVFSVFTFFKGLAQSDPQFSQYMFNPLMFNPAVAGSKEQISSSFLYKRRWLGLANASKIETFNIHAPFQYQKIGLGLMATNESFGIQNRLAVSASYAYKINLLRGTFSFGISAGIIQSSIKYNELSVLDEEKPYLKNLNVLLPDIGTGLYYQNKHFYMGISALHLIPNSLHASNYPFNNDIVKRHFYLIGGYKYHLTEKVEILPSTMLKYISNQLIQADFTLHLKYNDMIWAGASLRTNNAYSLQAGLKISELMTLTRQSIKIGYAYDWSDNALSWVSKGSHELMLILDLNIYENPANIKKRKINISPVLF